MRSFNVKLLCCIGLIAGMIVMLTGCGSGGDLLDEKELRYSAFMSLTDADEDNTLTIDVFQNPDCDGDPTTSDPEIFTDVFADIDIRVAIGSPGITLRDYTIEYIPLSSPDTLGVYRTGPDLIDITDHGSFTFSLTSGGTGSFTITCMSVDTKINYLDVWTSDPNLADLAVARYTIRITLLFEDEYLQDRTIVVERTVYLSAYNNC